MKKIIRRTLAIVLSLAMVMTTFTMFNKTVKADPIDIAVTSALESGQTHQLRVTWTNPQEVIDNPNDYHYGYYVNSIDNNNQCKAANNYVWGDSYRTMLDTVSGTNGGLDFKNGGDFAIIVVIYDTDWNVYATGTSNSIHMDPYGNTDAKFKWDRYEGDGKTTVVSWSSIANASTYEVYNKDTGAILASSGGSWVGYNTPRTTTLGDTYTAKLVAKNSSGDVIAITNDEIIVDYYKVDAPQEHTSADFSQSSWDVLNYREGGSGASDYSINSDNALGTFWFGIYSPHSSVSYHSQRTHCMLSGDSFTFQRNGITSVWVNGEVYNNPSTLFNNQGDCAEMSVDFFRPGINVVTLVLGNNDNNFETFGIKYVPEGFYDVSTYKSTTPYTYPTEAGKIFAGWYTDATCSTPYTQTTGYAYAKFIDEKVLTVKFQKHQTAQAIRFVSTIDNDLNYQEVGFEFSGTYGNHTIPTTTKTTGSVYTKITAGGESIVPSEAFENDDSSYFFTYTVRGMNGTTGSHWEVTPFYVTPDGTKVMGQEATHDMVPN